MNTDSLSYPYNGSPELRPEELPGTETEQQPERKAGDQPSFSRRALCIGINQYASSPLFGCVSDARRWYSWFEKSGFQTDILLDQDASRDRILSSMRDLVTRSSPGDVIAIQYSGHGTQLPDLNGDESGGDTPGWDEALVPVDYLSNGFVIDDDLAEVCDGIPPDVNVTFFFDCCHSGTATRLIRGPSGGPANEARPRFMTASPEMLETHIRTRQGTRGSSRSPENHPEILFAACQSSQVAWESAGEGDFTRNAVGVLETDPSSLTNAAFVASVHSAFGANPRQNPDVTCDDKFRNELLLGSRREPTAPKCNNPELQGLLGELRAIVDRIAVLA